MTHQTDKDIEKLSSTLHDIYQKEAHRQEDLGIGKARHYDEYEALSEPVKEFDRVLARYIISLLHTRETALFNAFAELIPLTPEDLDPTHLVETVKRVYGMQAFWTGYDEGVKIQIEQEHLSPTEANKIFSSISQLLDNKKQV